MSVYGTQQLAASMRAVRQNTILMASDIPEDKYNFRATPETRSFAQTLVHIAWLWSADYFMHEERRIETIEGFDFAALQEQSTSLEKESRSKTEIIELLRVEGDRAAQWIEALPDSFVTERVSLPGGGSVTRFEMLLATKEHELQHRAQLTVLTRLIGIAPRFTGLA